jgi:hypothetical protein
VSCRFAHSSRRCRYPPGVSLRRACKSPGRRDSRNIRLEPGNGNIALALVRHKDVRVSWSLVLAWEGPHDYLAMIRLAHHLRGNGHAFP